MAAVVPNMLGASPVFARVLDTIACLARFDAPVLLTGETGTGKELAARAIHYLSARAAAPFVPVNCGALPDTLIESELFGHERGAFTDARQSRAGLVEAARGGTLFLDEVDSLPMRAQAALLRFLQDQTFRPLGASGDVAGDVRIVAAASPRMQEMVEQGSFRADLAFRLDVLSIEMPPLRERTGDALLLAQHFAERHAARYRMKVRPFDADSLAWIEAHPWPGNVRELDNLVHRQTLLGQDAELRLAPEGWQASGVRPKAGPVQFNDARHEAMSAWERQYLSHLLRETGGNVTRAAQLAGKERRALGKLLKKHGIDRDLFGTA
ncbi:sigma-54 dependent transcriptional regulator [Uliginosibacterium sp. H3]|uniref:Sigma-54 dependent transcriptional regulator n=1 Tax=Uliginosibacterium silvisoli TaxID=3114758 RepID=A0ABU6K0X6_9RHOO|nr:sigma-54 dependent transcriptional regulator [Uliginosibacterium sp. H3]